MLSEPQAPSPKAYVGSPYGVRCGRDPGESLPTAHDHAL
jgi:hypothetical protein